MTVLALDEDEFIASGLEIADPEAASRVRAAVAELRAAAPDRPVTILGTSAGEEL